MNNNEMDIRQRLERLSQSIDEEVPGLVQHADTIIEKMDPQLDAVEQDLNKLDNDIVAFEEKNGSAIDELVIGEAELASMADDLDNDQE